MASEWRHGKRLEPMTELPAWITWDLHIAPRRKAKPKPTIQLRPCTICGEAMTRRLTCGTACSDERTRRTVRDKYRASVGLPVDPSRPTKPWIRAGRAGGQPMLPVSLSIDMVEFSRAVLATTPTSRPDIPPKPAGGA